MDTLIELAKQLINCPSITPHDHHCQTIIIEKLASLGFTIKDLSENGVSNFLATHGEGNPFFAFAGHTDVVPPGDENDWKTPPFSATQQNGHLIGRGAADMKGGIAAMLTAVETFLKNTPNHKGTIAFFITSDEEGPAEFGTKQIVNYCQKEKIKVDYCLIGEATCQNQFGDIIKIGRRGSIYGELIIKGIQGHIAYPNKTDNPIHKALPALIALTQIQWEQRNTHFQKTQLQIYDVQAGVGASNVVPGKMTVKFNLRYSPDYSFESIQEKIESVLNQTNMAYQLMWTLSSTPYFSEPKSFAALCQKAINKITGMKPICNTEGGTSDGRFIHALGCEVVEFGPLNESIHKVNEYVSVMDLEQLTACYLEIITQTNR